MANLQARWLVSLSNGETAIEGKDNYIEIEGELSPWQRLLLYVAKNKLEITGLRIQLEVEGQPVRTYNLPSRSPKQKWLNLKPALPNAFYYQRIVEQDMFGYIDDMKLREGKKFIEIRAVYNNFDLSMIVDEDEGNECWTLVIPK